MIFFVLGGILLLAALPAARVVLGYVSGVPAKISLAPVGNGQYLRVDAAKAFLAMQAAARAAGHNLTATSGFRSMDQQTSLYAKYIAGTGNLAAKPGYSNHQGGVSIDIGGVNSFTSPAYLWLAANARRFGFVNDVSTEYWHWTFKA